jgi:hypothetical protein
MGRPAKSAEERAAALRPSTAKDLKALVRKRERARRVAADADVEIRKLVLQAVEKEGASFRDLAALLGIRHQTLHQLVRPYRQRQE